MILGEPCIRARFHRLLKNSVQDALGQGTTLVVPFSCVKEHGFSRCNGMQGLKPVS
jgi:hypothetical protein